VLQFRSATLLEVLSEIRYLTFYENFTVHGYLRQILTAIHHHRSPSAGTVIAPANLAGVLGPPGAMHHMTSHTSVRWLTVRKYAQRTDRRTYNSGALRKPAVQTQTDSSSLSTVEGSVMMLTGVSTRTPMGEK